MSFLKSLLLTVLFTIPAITGWAQETAHSHEKHLSRMLNHYLDAKDALTEDDFDAARYSLSEFSKEVVENREMNNHKDHIKNHARHHSDMVQAVDKASAAGDIDELRSAFKDISAQLLKALENQGYDDMSLYLQYCPMAVNNQGAHWISDRETIINPYMGQKMTGCGKTEKEINPDN